MRTIESYNWSGARIVDDVLPLLKPPAKKFTSVKASWRVPTVELIAGKAESLSAAWIGLDGGTWGLGKPAYVLQVGTYHQATGPHPYFAFAGLDDGKGLARGEPDPYSRFFKFDVKPSDLIRVQLTYDFGLHEAVADFKGSSPQPSTFSFKVYDPANIITGYTTEWVFERISTDNDSKNYNYAGRYHELGNHSHLDFNDAQAQTDGGNWISADKGDSINMLDVDDYPTLLTAGIVSRKVVEIKQRND